jgi:hypothetical protein
MPLFKILIKKSHEVHKLKKEMDAGLSERNDR